MEKSNLFTFLDSIEKYIHPEVLKLYPEAELPTFKAEINNKAEMTLHYMSSRKLSDLAIGLIKGASKYFNETVDILKISEAYNGEKVVLKIKKN
jgi:hypothetical protein